MPFSLFRGIYLSSRRRDYMLSFSGLVTLAVVLPVLPTSFFLKYQLSNALQSRVTRTWLTCVLCS